MSFSANTRFNKRKRSFRRGYTSPSKRRRFSSAIARVAKRYKKSTGYVDTAVNTYAMNTTGAIALIPTIGQGTAVTQRVGKRIRLNTIQMRGYASSDSTTVQCNGAAMVVYDKRPTGSLPAITDILVSVNQNSFTNDDNTSRFKILRRWDWPFIGNNTTAGQQTEKTVYAINEFIKVNKQVIYKTGTTGVIAQIETGAVYLVTVGNVAASTADANLGVSFRTRFTDTDG